MRSLFPFRLGVEKKREMSIPGTNATTRHLLLTRYARFEFFAF
jgi:hypothetical protein